MRKLFYSIIILPIMCLSSLLLLVHDMIPSIWRQFLKPTVVKMRRARHHDYVRRDFALEKNHKIAQPIVSVFNKEFSIVIRLIRLVSEGSKPAITIEKNELCRSRVFA